MIEDGQEGPSTSRQVMIAVKLCSSVINKDITAYIRGPELVEQCIRAVDTKKSNIAARGGDTDPKDLK